MIITPAIFQSTYENVIHTLFLFEGLSERVQIDLCDGVMGLERTWLPYEETELPSGFSYEFDLMVKDWSKYLKRVLDLRADRVILHIDHLTMQDIENAVSIMSSYKAYLGLAVSNDYDLEEFIERVKKVEGLYSKLFIQVMGIRQIGAQGQPFDETVLSRVEKLHEAFRHFDIQVDGSMNKETAIKVLNRGASCAVVGSSLMKKGMTQAGVKSVYEELKNI